MKGNKKRKENDEIAKEWDEIAHFRLSQLENNEDISMDNILVPLLFEMSKDADFSKVIDLGCGTGYVTKKIATKAKQIIGIDISSVSILEAKKKINDIKNSDFIVSSIERFSETTNEKFTLAISNMTYMDVANLEKTIEGTSNLLCDGGKLIITITHPYFWPFYWNYANEDWFNYSDEIEIEEYFIITSSKSSYKTTHFHRPLEFYINTLTKYNFKVEKIYEPFPSKELNNTYPKKWLFPRFLGIKCTKFQK